jgi:membrane protein required for colicin V production
MPVIDIIIVIAIIVSVIIGLLRGFVKEAIAIAALLFAIWAALYLGPALGKAMAGWLDSEEMQVWFGRIFLFAVIVSLGALVSWGLSKLSRVNIRGSTMTSGGWIRR